jgi:sulfite exporter TauE/SafE
MTSSALGIVLGILVGLRHAFEADHLTAVSTLVAETHSPRTGALLGVLWGIGHTVSLVVVGVILVIVGATLPERAGVVFELGVAAMLLVLGVRTIALASRASTHTHTHPHSHSYLTLKSHPHVHEHTHVAAKRWRPVIVGLVHGLAGSGALTAIVFARLPGTAARILYMVLFGLGSIAGMAIASGLAGAALSFLARSANTRKWIAISTGILSIAVGILWSVPLM